MWRGCSADLGMTILEVYLSYPKTYLLCSTGESSKLSSCQLFKEVRKFFIWLVFLIGRSLWRQQTIYLLIPSFFKYSGFIKKDQFGGRWDPDFLGHLIFGKRRWLLLYAFMACWSPVYTQLWFEGMLVPVRIVTVK